LKLNHDLVRLLLLEIEDKTGPYDSLEVPEISIAEYTEDEVFYTAERLLEAGYIKAQLEPTQISHSRCIYSLTWEGHKYLDIVRDKDVWKQTRIVIKKFSSVSFSLACRIAEQILLDKIRGTY
jgi:DNA-binding PadR family transcriptional regulator